MQHAHHTHAICAEHPDQSSLCTDTFQTSTVAYQITSVVHTSCCRSMHLITSVVQVYHASSVDLFALFENDLWEMSVAAQVLLHIHSLHVGYFTLTRIGYFTRTLCVVVASQMLSFLIVVTFCGCIAASLTLGSPMFDLISFVLVTSHLGLSRARIAPFHMVSYIFLIALSWITTPHKSSDPAQMIWSLTRLW